MKIIQKQENVVNNSTFMYGVIIAYSCFGLQKSSCLGAFLHQNWYFFKVFCICFGTYSASKVELSHKIASVSELSVAFLPLNRNFNS